MKKYLLVLFCLVFYAQANGQCELYTKNMTSKIDSIAKIHEIKQGCVIIGRERQEGTLKTDIGEFKFDGPFLVLLRRYYNMNKLMYFYVANEIALNRKEIKVIYFVFETD